MQEAENPQKYQLVTVIPVKNKRIYEDTEGYPFTMQLPWNQNALHIVSNVHKRSVEDVASNNTVIWGDEYGTFFGARGWKGISTLNPSILCASNLPYGMQTYGLLDETGHKRCENASQVLRSNGLATERIVQRLQLEEIVVNGKPIRVGAWKRSQLKRIDSLFVSGNNGKTKYFMPLSKARYLLSNNFYYVERDYQVGERLCDLQALNKCVATNENGKLDTEATYANYLNRLDRIMKWNNLRTNLEKKRFQTRGQRFASWKLDNFDTSKEMLQRYFTDYLPRSMGMYLARMHNLGLAHGFPTLHNWSAVGTLYDLDSVHGEPLGDDPVEFKHFREDVTTTTNSLRELFTSSQTFYLPTGLSINVNFTQPFLGTDTWSTYQRALSTFVRAYNKVSGGIVAI